MIRLDSISKSFEGKAAMTDVSAVFHQGRPNLIIGRSGSGKTVLMKCIIGLLTPDSGEIYYGEEPFSSFSEAKQNTLRQEMGVVFQGGALFDSLTVEQNLRLPMDFFTDWSRGEKRNRANFCLERVNLPGVNKLYPAELSGGMKKRVAIARAIALNPKYLFCDEPNSGLDPQTAILIDNLLLELTRDFKMTTIINTHDLNSVMEIGENILFLSGGRRCWEGTREEILISGNPILNEFVFASELMKKMK